MLVPSMFAPDQLGFAPASCAKGAGGRWEQALLRFAGAALRLIRPTACRLPQVLFRSQVRGLAAQSVARA